jgi:signal transduction histidine kinase
VTAILEEIVAYVALDADDRARLAALHTVLAPELPAIADAFYAATQRSPRASAILGGAGPARRLHAALVDWMSSGLLGPYDEAFHVKRSRIGRRHVELGLDQHYMVTGIHVIRRAYRERIITAYPASEAHVVGQAVDKLLDLELALMLRHYQLDSEARVIAAERERRLEHVEAMQTLCAGLAHEVRNPLNSAKLQLALVARRLRRAGDDPKLVGPIELAGHEIDRLTNLLDEFLAFARPPGLDSHAQDVVGVVREVVESDRALAFRHGAALTLADGDAPVIAEVDAAKLRQIVDSLVCNAIEAVISGGRVLVAVEQAADQVHIRVTDDGPGIPSEILPRIYEPFFSTKEGGTGMGLSIAHSLVALHRGTIAVASSPSGTTFDVAMPRRQATPA